MTIREIQQLLVRLTSDHLSCENIPEIQLRILGNMNDIYKVSVGDQNYGLRVRTQDFQTKIFEQKIIKEVFAIFLMQEKKLTSREIQEEFKELLKQESGENITSSLVKDIIYYDWSQQSFSQPYTFYKWNEGDCLWFCQQDIAKHYGNVGELLATFHHITFDSFYEDLQAVSIGQKQSYVEKYWGRMSFYLEKARETLPAIFIEEIRNAVAALKLDDEIGNACLVHNDYTGGNILVCDNAYKVIDWDVWEVNRPESDLVSQKYFTRIGNDGLLIRDDELYQSFIAGYQKNNTIFDERVFRAEEIKWLLRLYLHFTHARRDVDEENQANLFTKLYPESDFFLEGLKELIN